MKTASMKIILGGVLAASLLVSPAFAQSSSGAWNGLADRFQIDTGYFRLSADTVLRFNGPQGSGDVNLEKDLGVNENVNTFWVDATWRVGRRHQLKLAYTRFSRDRADYTLAARLHLGRRDLQRRALGDDDVRHRHPGGLLPFRGLPQRALRDRPDRRHRLPLDRTPASRPRARSADRRAAQLDQSASTGSITGAVGGYTKGWLTKRLVSAGGLPLHQGESGRYGGVGHRLADRGGLLLLPNAGLGVQYKYNKYSYDRGILVTKLGGQMTFQGGQIFLTFLF